MLKKTLALTVLLACLLLCACAEANEYKLSLVPDGQGQMDYIYFDEDRTIYTVGGIVMAELDGQSIALESALNEGKLSVSDLLASAKKDVDGNKMDYTTYPDGSVEYVYSDFRLVVLNTATDNSIYFIPLYMNYYSVLR